MNELLPKKIRDLTPYDPIQGDYQIRLDANESFLHLTGLIKGVIARRLSDAALNRYPDPYAQKLCRAFGAFYGVDPALVTAGNGSDELISILVGCFLDKGSCILTFAPDFSMYRFYGDLYEDRVVVLPKREDLTIDVDAAIQAVKEQNIGMVLFSNPCNPTSLGLSADKVRRLVSSVDALVVLDEAYMDFYDQSLLDEVQQYDNLVILRTCSKALGLAGIRLGFAVANKTLTRALRAAKSPYNVNSITQIIGYTVLEHPDMLRRGIQQIIASREELYQAVSALAERFPALETVHRPDTNFVFVKTGLAKELYQGLLQRSIAVRLMGDHLRITAGTKEENAAVVAALEELLQQSERREG